DPEHVSVLVELVEEGAPDPHRAVEVSRQQLAVDVAVVMDVAVARCPPEVRARVHAHPEHIAGALPAGGLIQPLHGVLRGSTVSTVSVSGPPVVSGTWTKSSEQKRNGGGGSTPRGKQ